MKYNLIVGGNSYNQLSYSEIILYIRKLVLNEVSIDFSIELKNSNMIEGIDKFINAGSLKIQVLNFSCVIRDFAALQVLIIYTAIGFKTTALKICMFIPHVL